MTTVIKVENLSKRYRLGLIGGKTLREDVQRWWTKFRDKSDPLLPVDYVNPLLKNLPHEIHDSDSEADFIKAQSSEPSAPSSSLSAPSSSPDYIWALKDVSFKVKQGEILGIIGKNGAGKSTLLKILTKITAPTHGFAKIKGRVGSLLEVGTGFHPELTGRENIFLNGAILGMTKTEIRQKFDEIVEFAEIEKFIDTPAKRYSSGMYVRLAFAVAAHLEPEILLVDEVLAVGDLAFQKKCLGKMSDVSKEGRTILFVSHNMTAIKSLCDFAIQLDQGKIEYFGKTDDAVKNYLDYYADLILERKWSNIKTAPGNDVAKIQSAKLIAPNNDDVISVDTDIHIEFTYWHLKESSKLNLSMHVHLAEGPLVFASTSTPQEYSKGLIRFICNIPRHFLNDETYSISIAIVRNSSEALFWVNEVIKFEVREKNRGLGWLGKYPGFIRPKLNWSSSLSKVDL